MVKTTRELAAKPQRQDLHIVASLSSRSSSEAPHWKVEIPAYIYE